MPLAFANYRGLFVERQNAIDIGKLLGICLQLLQREMPLAFAKYRGLFAIIAEQNVIWNCVLLRIVAIIAKQNVIGVTTVLWQNAIGICKLSVHP